MRRGPQIIALALSLLSAGILPQVALCVGPGGHYAIEPISAECCHPPAALGDARTQVVACAQDCADTALAAGPVISADRISRLISPAVPVVAVVFAMPMQIPPGQRFDFDLIVSPTTSPPRLLSTTIQRC